MSDLISRQALEKSIREYADDVGCNRGEYELANGILKSLSILKIAPIAYDVDKVVEQMQRNCHNYYPTIDSYCVSEKAVKLKDTVSIVKGGGIQ